MKNHYIFSIGAVALMNMILAVLALIKDIFTASYMGTTTTSDAFMLAFFITDMIGNNLIAAALGVSCIPTFTKLSIQKNQASLYQCIKKINYYILILSSITAVFIFLFRNTIVRFLGSGFTQETQGLSIEILLLLLPTVLLYPVVSVSISVLQVRNKFIISSLVPILFNLIFLIGILYCYIFKIPIERGVYITAWVVVLAVVTICVVVFIFVLKEKQNTKHSIITISVDVKNIFKMFIPYLFILLLGQLILYVERYLASEIQAGSVAALNYAYRLAQFPIWIFVSAISTVVFPMMSKYSSREDTSALKKLFEKAVWYMLIITLPMTVILYILRDAIITVLFLRGSFTLHSLTMTSEILSGYVFVILGQSVTNICLRFLLAIEKVTTTLFVFLGAFILNVILDVYLVPIMNLSAFGYGAAVSGLFTSIILLSLMKIDIKQYFYKGYYNAVKLIVVNGIVVVICIIANYFWTALIFESIFLLKFFYLGGVMMMISLLYFMSLKRLKII